MLRRLLIFGLVFGLGAVTLRSQAPLPRSRNPDAVPADAVIALAEHGLFIRVLADGTVLVEGETFDFDISRIKMRIGSEDVKRLIDEFERIRFFSLNDRYYDRADGCSQQGAGCTFIAITTSFTLNGKSKSITHLPYECLENDGSSYPRDLVALEKQIEEAVDLNRRR
jgi:hypothetical protein